MVVRLPDLHQQPSESPLVSMHAGFVSAECHAQHRKLSDLMQRCIGCTGSVLLDLGKAAVIPGSSTLSRASIICIWVLEIAGARSFCWENDPRDMRAQHGATHVSQTCD